MQEEPTRKISLSKSQRDTRNKGLFVFCIAILLFCIIGFLLKFILEESTLPITKYIINTPGCAIPALDITNPKIAEYIFEANPIKCDKYKALMASNLTSIYILPNKLKELVLTQKDITCCYSYFKRKSPDDYDDDNLVTFNKEECIDYTNFINGLNVDKNEDFVKVKCNQTGKLIYTDYFHFISDKPDLEEKQNQEIEKNVSKDELNVLIFGIDAVSRMNLHRQMPNTVEYLNHLQAVEMLGYNKIGDNTYPNLFAVLTGDALTALLKKHRSYYCDRWDLVWKRFKAKNYVTAFAEDDSKSGLFIDHLKGFLEQPTDYYYNHFDTTAVRDIGYTTPSAGAQCLGSRPSYKVFLQYASNFVTKMYNTGQNYFGFFWTSSLTHDYLNNPSLGDDDIRNWLMDLNVMGVLNNTALFFISDHGMRYGAFRSTYQGSLEGRLPFVFVVLPQWFKDKYPHSWHNLNMNKGRLTTPYDLHETLLDLSGVSQSLNYSKRLETKSKGISLFEPISNMRTCQDAHIDPHWCTCKRSDSLEVNDQRIVDSVYHVVYKHLNKYLKSFVDCYQLKLDVILDGRQVTITTTNEVRDKEAESFEYFMVTFKTKPGGAVLEATVKSSEVREGKFYYEMAGNVSRLNLYGTQSKCVKDVYAKLFCLCK